MAQAETPGVLYDGYKKKVVEWLRDPENANSSTADLCNAFKRLFYHRDYVMELARIFGMPDTVKDWPSPGVSAGTGVAKSAPPSPAPTPQRHVPVVHNVQPLKPAAAAANMHPVYTKDNPPPGKVWASTIIKPDGSEVHTFADAEPLPTSPEYPTEQELTEGEIKNTSDVEGRLRKLESNQRNMMTVLSWCDRASKRFWAFQKHGEIRNAFPSFFSSEKGDEQASASLFERAKEVQSHQAGFTKRQKVREVARDCIANLNATPTSGTFASAYQRLADLSYWKGVLAGSNGFLKEDLKKFYVPLNEDLNYPYLPLFRASTIHLDVLLQPSSQLLACELLCTVACKMNEDSKDTLHEHVKDSRLLQVFWVPVHPI